MSSEICSIYRCKDKYLEGSLILYTFSKIIVGCPLIASDLPRLAQAPGIRWVISPKESCWLLHNIYATIIQMGKSAQLVVIVAHRVHSWVRLLTLFFLSSLQSTF